jgi:hypothetical protein
MRIGSHVSWVGGVVASLALLVVGGLATGRLREPRITPDLPRASPDDMLSM